MSNHEIKVKPKANTKSFEEVNEELARLSLLSEFYLLNFHHSNAMNSSKIWNGSV